MPYITVITVLSSLFFSMSTYANYTEPRLYQPYSSNAYQQKLKIKRTLIGHCRKQSEKDKRTDAWHCEVEGKSYDPCFKHKYVNQHELVCPNSPWSSKAVRILTTDTLDSKKNHHLDMSKTAPWAMELKDGSHCLFMSRSKNDLPRYECQNHQYLSGNLFRCKGNWQIYKQKKDEAQLTEVKRAWF